MPVACTLMLVTTESLVCPAMDESAVPSFFADELVAFCKERMAAYKYPRQVVIVDELPKTATGKILRRELR